MRNIVTNLLAIAATATLGAPAAMAADPYAMPDDSWISISGTAVAPTADSFILDYGEGTVLVEMDDWDWYGDAYGIVDGDQVTVYGEVDDDLYELTSIEAGSVYVQGLNSYFYANSADEEDWTWVTSATPIVIGTTILRGTVSSVDPAAREFTIDTGKQKLTVDTLSMAYNPLDDAGYQKIEKGDRVSVSGNIDVDFFDGRHLEADSVITLSDASTKQQAKNTDQQQN